MYDSTSSNQKMGHFAVILKNLNFGGHNIEVHTTKPDKTATETIHHLRQQQQQQRPTDYFFDKQQKTIPIDVTNITYCHS